MNGDVSIDFGSALPYLVHNLKELFGTDDHSRHILELVDKRAKLSFYDASIILIAGMSRKTSLEKMYQVLAVSRNQYDETSTLSVDDIILRSKESAILFAAPGRGKSVTLQHAYLRLKDDKNTLPLLYFLRQPGSMAELFELGNILKTTKGQRRVARSQLVLLLDGYDEIEYSDRVSLSALLRDLEGAHGVRFILTCRTYYEIVDLRVDRYYLQPFTRQDSLAFLSALLAQQNSMVSAVDLLDMMDTRGFSDFVSNPLLLALSVVLKKAARPEFLRM